jgi:putative hydrolase of the HAD superfamily
MSLSGIEWVVFDAVGTLFFADPPVHMAYHRIGRKYGSTITPELALKRFREAFVRPSDDLRTSPEREREFWKSLVAQVLPDVQNADACFNDLWEHFTKPSSWFLYLDFEETSEQLRSRGLKLAIASNFDERLHPVCDGHADLCAIDKRFVSSEIGWKKPAREFFEAVIQGCGVPASKILFVGDDLHVDILPARHAGMHALLIDRSQSGGEGLESLTDLLAKLG